MNMSGVKEIVNIGYSPAYLQLGKKEFEQRIRAAFKMLAPCRLCPRKCGVDRPAGEKGVCGAGAVPEVSSANLHHGEEPALSGWRGSGTIFFAHCNLRCVFCQNYPISQLGHGNETDSSGLAEMMIGLQHDGAHNINFVTPTHMVPWILEAVLLARAQGLKIPLLYNAGGYESLEALKLLNGIIDIYLPDMKYSDNQVAKKYSNAPDYVEVNRAAIKEMHRQVGDLVTDDTGIAGRGLIIRHLVLPEGRAGTEGIMKFIAEEVSCKTAISLMSQYFPAHRAREFPELCRRISESEYARAEQAMAEQGLEEGWKQGI
jgi:putative pyruvate formate lyase activating enzyme